MYIAPDHFTQDFANSLPNSALPLACDHLWRVLDEIDYGLIMVTPAGWVQHANHLARYELARGKFLTTAKPAESSPGHGDTGQLQTTGAPETAELLRGIRAAARGRRQMLTLRHQTDSLPLACVPLFQPFEGECTTVLLMLARQTGTANLAVTFFARTHKLTSAEESVLRALCNGQEIQDIATRHGVAESTIRTQVRALRDKTQCHSIRILVQQVAALPPVVPVSLMVNSPPRAPS
jgi:DNA-binding CsgD family transcriptional regulator